MLISAAVGAGTGAAGSAISGGDPLKGALTGAAMGAVTGGIGSSIGGLANTSAGALSGAETVIGEQALSAANPAFLDPTLYPGGMPDVSAASSTAFTPPPAVPPPVAPPPVQQLGVDALSGNSITTPQNQISQGITSLNNVASQNPITTLNPTANPVNPASPTPKGMFDFGYKGPTPNVFEYGPQSNLALGGIGATSGISAAMQAERDRYSVPETEKYTGPLSRFKYDPSTYNPDIVRPPNPPYRAVYAAEGGIMSLAPNGYAMGGMPPQTNFANPSSYEEGTSQYSMATDPMSGNIANRMAAGGITSLGSYSDGGRLLKGPGDGMSDNIPARIGRKQEARLADGEFVVPADVVSHLGNGSTDAGAKTLYAMMSKVRKARTGNKKQGRQIEASSYLPA
jgi:hypothetical protein